MINVIEKDKCVGCGGCKQSCPKDCIEMIPDHEGFNYPIIKKKLCINCGLCIEVCPIEKQYYSFDYQAYAMKSKRKEERLSASSGGIFFLIAKNILMEGGVVFGASWTSNLEVQHVFAENIEDLSFLKKSKYIQSDIGDTYLKCKYFLDQGKKVLYSGTPCQIAGLKSFLKRDYKQLFLIDIICHGVPNKIIWKKYITELENKKNKTIEEFDFRYKKENELHANKFYIKIKYADGESEIVRLENSEYFQGFSENLFLRPSCYSCRYKGFGSGADITLGDYWGIEIEHPEISDSHGISAVITLSEKGCYLIDKIRSSCDFVDTSLDKISKHNTIFIPARKNNNRENFFHEFLKNQKSIFNIINKLKQKNTQQYEINVWGSYNTRVAVVESQNKLGLQFSNMRVGSQFMSPPIDNHNFHLPNNNYRQQMFRLDFSKNIFLHPEVLFSKMDYLIIDFLEERFKISKYNNSYFTVSDAWSDNNDPSSIKVISKEEEDRLWKSGCDTFITLLNNNIKKEKVILCKMYLSSQIGLNEPLLNFDNKSKIEEINEKLKAYYDYFEKHYLPVNVVQVDREYNYSHKFHLYGCVPEHLNYKAYYNLSQKINRIIGKGV